MPQTGKPLGSMVIKLGLDGSKFTDTLANIQRSLKTQLSTMRANLKVYDAVGDNLGKLENNYKDLKSTIALLEKENEHLTASYKKHVEAGTENSKAAQNLAKKINDNIQKQALYRKQLSQTERALDDEKSGMNDLREEISRVEQSTQALVQKNKAMGRSLAANKEEYNGLKTVIDKRNQLIDKEKAKLAELIRTKGHDDSATADQRLAIQKLEAAQAAAIDRYKKLDMAIGNSSDRMIRFQDNLSRARKSLQSTADKISATGQSISSFFGGATLAIGGGLGLATKSAMDFESQMSNVKSVMDPDDAKKYGKALQDLAITMGSKTKYSATEAAQGIEELVKAGVSTKDIMHGGLKGALDLATAGELSLKDAAEIASTALNSFKDDNISVTDAANQLAGAANASATDVGEMKFALSSVSAVAAGVGLSFKDTNTALAELAQNGLKGQDAGTSLKTMLLNLSPSTKSAADMMDSLGLATKNVGAAYQWLVDRGIKPASHSSKDVDAALQKLAKIQAGAGASASKVKKEYQELAKNSGFASSAFYDQHGKLKSLSEISGLLHDRLKNLTEEQRQNALKTMFGTDAIRAANILYKEGAKGADDMAKSISKIKASEVAEQKMKNLKGTIEQLKGSLETAGITIGYALLPALSKITKVVQKAVDWFNHLSPATQHFLAISAGVVTVSFGIAAAMGAMTMAIGGGISAVAKLVGGFKQLVKFKGFLSDKMFAGLGAKNAIKLKASLAWDGVKSGLGKIGSAAKKLGSAFKWAAHLTWTGVQKALSGIKIAGKATRNAFVWTGKVMLTGAKKSIEGIGTAARVSGRWIGTMTKAAFAFGKTSAIWAAQKLKILAVAAAEKISAAATKAWAFAQKILNLAMKANPIGLVITAVASLAIGLVALYKHSKKFRDFVNGIGQKAKEMANSVKSHVSSMVSGVKSKFANMKNTAVNLAGSMANQVSNKHSWLNKHTNGAAKSMFTGLKKTYQSGHKTLENATQTFKDLVSGKWSKLGGDIKKTTKSALNTAKNYYKSGFSALNSLTGGRLGDMFSKVKSFSSKVVSTFKSLPSKVASGIKNGAKTIANAGKSVGNSLLKAIGKPVNGVIKGVNWVLKRVGAKNHLISYWDVPQYARGTKGHPQDGPMIVGDGGKKELVQFPNGKTFLSPDKPMLMFAPKGTQVVDGDNTKKLMTMAGIPKYAFGIGWLKDKISGGWNKLESIGDSIWEYVSHPTKLLNTVIEKYAGSSLASLSEAVGDIASGSAKTIIKDAASWIKKMFGSTANPPGSGVQRWRPYVIRALAMNGLSTSKAMVEKVLRQIATESGGNPLAVQHGYTDINTIHGDLAKGLMQTISATFNAYKFPGHDNIFNGFDNLLAALNYAKHRYGKSLSALGQGHGYANGGLVTKEQIAKIGEGNKAEMVIPLTNKTRAIQLMMQALAIIGGNGSSGTSTGRSGAGTVDMTDTNNLLKQLINLVASIDPNVYLDGKKLYDNNKKYSNQEANIRNVFKGVMSIG
ncbi:phage tail tape measure protein [Heyndrickxia coagulans]|uniref:phage tail tape measure protein n=2 Tax=Bacillales TaxID=1385 RepID=UPI002E052518|nr:phage tail tape measure protein [Heyndrickxia coagulans]MEC5268274.1 phage tail tape measure protein [Heyndrickxia coagulans]